MVKFTFDEHGWGTRPLIPLLDADLMAKAARYVNESADLARLKGPVREEYARRSWTTWTKVMTPVTQANHRQIDAAGGVIALGSDQSSGPASHRELELLVNGGVPALNASRIGTLHGAIFMGKERALGSIEAGKLADLVLLDADQLRDVRSTERINLVIKGGVPVDRKALDLPVNRQAKQAWLGPADQVEQGEILRIVLDAANEHDSAVALRRRFRRDHRIGGQGTSHEVAHATGRIGNRHRHALRWPRQEPRALRQRHGVRRHARDGFARHARSHHQALAHGQQQLAQHAKRG